MKTVYKITTQYLQSPCTSRTYRLQYSQTELIKPIIGKIFAFQVMEFALAFAREVNSFLGEDEKYILWKAETTKFEVATSVCYSCEDNKIEEFWREHKHCIIPIIGTVFCDDLQLIDQIKV